MSIHCKTTDNHDVESEKLLQRKHSFGFLSIILIFFIVAAASLIGLLTRPDGNGLVTIWPGNAILLGLFIRFPSLNKWYNWLAAFTAYFLMDLSTGGSLNLSIALNIVNIISIATGYTIYKAITLKTGRKEIDSPQSVLNLFFTILSVALTSGVLGALVNPFVFKYVTPIEGFKAWFTGEFVNYMVVLPIIMTFQIPKQERIRPYVTRKDENEFHWIRIMPLIALLLSLILSHYLAGPGAIAYSVPALLWCSITYNIFNVSILNFIFSFATLMSLNYISEIGNNIYFGPGNSVISMRIGVAMITLAPLLICSIIKSRNDLLTQLEHIATHDCLTSTLNRSGIDKHYRNYRLSHPHRKTGILIIDLDYFKQINDTYGHDAGDLTLKEFANIIRSNLRDSDIFGRIGGEEFIVILPLTDEAELDTIAERFCETVAHTPFSVSPTGTLINLTISIGAVEADRPYDELDHMLAEADKALYYVKNNGRNCYKITNYASEQSPPV